MAVNTLGYPDGGGHLWVHLNWALSLRALGCRVIWLEPVAADVPPSRIQANVRALKSRLERHGLAGAVALCSLNAEPLPPDVLAGCLDLDAAAEADLLLNLRYGASREVVGRFQRSALVDIDPGLLQIWMARRQLCVAPHDCYFSIGETVGTEAARFPDCGLAWHYTPPPVFLDAWPAVRAGAGAPYTTVSGWWNDWMEWDGEIFPNDKRAGFLEYLDFPARADVEIELALCLGPGDEAERRRLEEHGWRVRDSREVSSTPGQYRSYIQRSRGEFSCAKPSCMRLENAWISDRTLCYLASGKPAVVQHTGPSRFLPDAEGLFRFRSPDEAARALSSAEADYDRHSRLARTLVETYFDGRQVVARVLESAGVDHPATSRVSAGPVGSKHRTLAILSFHKIGETPPGGWDTWFRIPEATFVAQLSALPEQGWEVIDLATFVASLDAPDALPERAALLTFDDGYRSVREIVLPWLRRLDYPAVVFVPTDFIGGSNRFDAGQEPTEAICDWDDLRELQRSGISVQSHGASHRRFSELGLAEQERELRRSKTVLEDALGEAVRVFSYPYGDSGPDPAAVGAMLKRIGYRSACLYGGGPNRLPVADVYRLTRLAMGPDSDLARMLAEGSRRPTRMSRGKSPRQASTGAPRPRARSGPGVKAPWGERP
jgi:peptidoglycan/xylan/chitin deacetylase (PgdA/CDA1 family)